MNTAQLLEGLTFNENNPNAQTLHVDKDGRAIRFTLRPGQSVAEHNAPHSPVHIVVLKGHGIFSGGDGTENLYGPNSLLIFDKGENHAIRALDEELVFLLILHGVPKKYGPQG